MDVREFVIRLVLDAMGFKQQVEAAQKELDELGRAAQKASQQAGAGLDDVAKAAAAAETDLRDVGQQASRPAGPVSRPRRARTRARPRGRTSAT